MNGVCLYTIHEHLKFLLQTVYGDANFLKPMRLVGANLIVLDVTVLLIRYRPGCGQQRGRIFSPKIGITEHAGCILSNLFLPGVIMCSLILLSCHHWPHQILWSIQNDYIYTTHIPLLHPGAGERVERRYLFIWVLSVSPAEMRGTERQEKKSE